MRNPGRIWQVKETGKLAFSYHKEQRPEFGQKGKILVYISEISQPTLFDDLPPVETCRHVLKDISTLKLIGFLD